MRCISNDDFWGAARSGWQGQSYDQKIAALYADSVENPKDEFCDRLDLLLQLRLDVARLNHCSNHASIRDYHKQLVALMHDVYGEAHLLPALSGTNPPSFVISGFHARVEDLNHFFDQQRRCHPSYSGFVCYCDEH